MDHFDPVAVKRLFQAVVTQALIDACSPEPKWSDKPVKRAKGEDDITYYNRNAAKLAKRKAKAYAIRSTAREWLTEMSDDFAYVVSLAGYNPDDIKERSVALERRDWAMPTRVEFKLVA